MAVCSLNYVKNSCWNALVAPLAVRGSVKSICRATWGVAATALSIATLGKVSAINRWAGSVHSSANVLLPPYAALLKVVHPNVMLYGTGTMGILTKRFAQPFFKQAAFISQEPEFIKRHILSRLCYGLGLVASTISRVADLALGLVAAALSLVPLLGRSQAVNVFAYRQLSATLVVADICFSLRAIVNPHQVYLGGL